MTREQAREKVLDYAYGDLSAEDAAAFEAVLRDDPELRDEVGAIRALRQAASSLPKPALPPAMRADLLRAARAETRRRATLRRWEEWRSFFLSPVFLAASAVIAAVGVGVHLITLHGTDDPWTRMDREQRMAALEAPAPAPAAPPAGEAVAPAAEPPPVVAAADKAEAEAETVAAAAARSRSRAGSAPRPAAQPAKASRTEADVDALLSRRAGGKKEAEGSAGGLGLLGGAGRGGGGAAATGAAGWGVASEAPAPKTASPRPSAMVAAPSPPADRARGTVDFDDETLESNLLRPDDSDREDRPTASAPAAAQAAPALEAARAAPAAEDKANEMQDPVILLERAREHRLSGRFGEALAASRAYLATDPAGFRLADGLAEAALSARALGLESEMEGYLARLEQLPGGNERAARIRAK